MEEIWKKIDNFNYEVSNTGKVRMIGSCDVIRGYASKNEDRIRVILIDENLKIKKNFTIHTLVWNYFGDPEIKGKFVIHKDKDMYNCHINNLKKVNSVAYHKIGIKPKDEKVKKEKKIKEKKVIKEKIAKPKVYNEKVKAINREVFERNFNNKGHYINNQKLIYQVILSKGLGKPTEELKKMLWSICFGVHLKLQKTYPMEYRYDILTDTYIHLLTKYNRFNEKAYDNCLAYFSELAKRGLAHFFNAERFKTYNYQSFGRNRFIYINQTFGH